MGCANSKFEGVDAARSSSAGRQKSGSFQKHAPKVDMPDFGVADWYKVHELLGRGGSGETFLCTNVLTEQKVAVKFIPRPIPKPVLPMIKHEIQIQGEFGEGHLNIINASEALLSHSHLCIVMEYAAGGTLTKHVSDRWNSTDKRNGLFLDEDEARYFFRQFVGAVEHLHNHNVVHRDLKLDNTLLDLNDPPRIKLCDFGFARAWDEGNAMHTQIGTPVYMSPQLISARSDGESKGYDGRKADVWACGVLLFVMLLGMFPFDHVEHPDPNSSAAQVEVWLQQIKASWRENPRVADVAKKLSEECRDLLDRIFDLEESRRFSIPEVKQHPWFTKQLPPKFEEAWQNLCTEQRAIDERVEAGLFKSQRRDDAIASMVEKCASLGSRADKVFKVPLNRVQTRYSILMPNDVALKIAEEMREEFGTGSVDGDRSKKGLKENETSKISLAELRSGSLAGMDSPSTPKSKSVLAPKSEETFTAADI